MTGAGVLKEAENAAIADRYRERDQPLVTLKPKPDYVTRQRRGGRNARKALGVQNLLESREPGSAQGAQGAGLGLVPAEPRHFRRVAEAANDVQDQPTAIGLAPNKRPIPESVECRLRGGDPPDHRVAHLEKACATADTALIVAADAGVAKPQGSCTVISLT